MAHLLTEFAAFQIASGLKRKSISLCSKWAEQYRIMGKPFPGPFNFLHHPWTKDVHDCIAEITVTQKAAQMGWTETALDKVFKTIDIDGISCLYVLPTDDDANDFSASRFDPAIENSPHLASLFSNVKNVKHKRAGTVNLFIRGSNSRSKLKSIPVGYIVFDEVNEMNMKNIPLALERTSGHDEVMADFLSTPTVGGVGISVYYEDSTQNHYYFKCPHCSRQTELIFPDCLIVTAESINDPSIKNSHLICPDCKVKLDHASKTEWLSLSNAEWLPTKRGNVYQGFYINQLYSMTSACHPIKLAESFLRAQSDPTEEQELYNSKGGMTHEVKDSRITDEDIKECIGTHKCNKEGLTQSALVTMGVDVGKKIHVELDSWFFGRTGTANPNDVSLLAKPVVLDARTVDNFEELDDIFRDYRVSYCVIDIQPDTRKAREFANRFFGRVKLCRYPEGVNSKEIRCPENDEEHSIHVNRTSWLDLSLGRFRNRTISLPLDVSHEYRNQIKAQIRVYDKDKNGNPVGRYVTPEKEQDHFGHARNYAEIALPLAVGLVEPRDVKAPV